VENKILQRLQFGVPLVIDLASSEHNNFPNINTLINSNNRVMEVRNFVIYNMFSCSYKQMYIISVQKYNLNKSI